MKTYLIERFKKWWHNKFHRCEPDVLSIVWFDAPRPLGYCMHCNVLIERNDQGYWNKPTW